MNIEAKGFKIEMTYNELWNTAFDIRRALENEIKTHWVRHQQNWEINEKERLSRCKQMFTSLVRPDLYDEIFTIAKDAFNEFNEKQSK